MTSQPLTFMSARSLTIILNTHSKTRIPVLIEGESMLDLKGAILRESQTKFRQSGFSRVFVHGGQELQYGETLPSSVKEVFVSAGEEYIPPPADTRIIRTKSIIQDQAVQQLEIVSKLPGVHVVVGFPDLHAGVRFPTGCAIAADVVYPALIGSDIGCGIAVYALTPPLRARPSAAGLANLLRGLDGPWDGDVRAWLESHGIYRQSPFDASCLGTVGGGNHFAEISLANAVVDRDGASGMGFLKGALYLVVHTGSRGLGAAIQAAKIGEDFNLSLPTYSSTLDSYLEDHDYAVRWAAANRDLVAHRIMKCLSDNTDYRIELKKLMDVTHNSVTKSSLKLSDSDEATGVWIHRKGAASIDQGYVPCPGSRGDLTWILKPLGSGHSNLHSLAHGAGRHRPRQEMHIFPPFRESLLTTVFGSAVVCTDTNLLIEERPEAYKPIACVVGDMEDEGICRRVGSLIPVVHYKVREGAQQRP